MSDLFAAIEAAGIVPVIAIEDAAHAVPLADALLEGGLPVAEITFRTPAAADAIARISRDRPEFTVGAGTLLDRASVDAAHDSGATFGLAPGLDAGIVTAAREKGFAFAPGVMTPSELGAAVGLGTRVLKFFPAGVAGGPAALDGIVAPFWHLRPRFIPTGGVTQATMGEWLRMPAVLAVGGTWIARTDDIRNRRWADITSRARAAVTAARHARQAQP